jgi:hypothetical protein
MDLMLGLLSMTRTQMKKNSLKKPVLKVLKVSLRTQMGIRKCLKITNTIPSLSRVGPETCILLSFRSKSTTIFTSSRVTSSPTIRETTPGTKLNSIILTRKTGTKRLKPQLVIPIIIQEAVFLEEKSTPLLRSPFLTAIVSIAGPKLLELKSHGFLMGQDSVLLKTQATNGSVIKIQVAEGT